MQKIPLLSGRVETASKNAPCTENISCIEFFLCRGRENKNFDYF